MWRKRGYEEWGWWGSRWLMSISLKSAKKSRLNTFKHYSRLDAKKVAKLSWSKRNLKRSRSRNCKSCTRLPSYKWSHNSWARSTMTLTSNKDLKMPSEERDLNLLIDSLPIYPKQKKNRILHYSCTSLRMHKHKLWKMLWRRPQIILVTIMVRDARISRKVSSRRWWTARRYLKWKDSKLSMISSRMPEIP